MRRFFSASDLRLDEEITFGKTQHADELKHLRKVLRSKVGDTIELINGAGVAAEGKILSLNGDAATIRIAKQWEIPPAKKKLILIQALIKLQRLDWLVEKVTELGVTELWLTPSEFSSVSLEECVRRIDRWNRIMQAAGKQSGNPWFPVIRTFQNFTDCIQEAKIPKSLQFFGDLRTGAPSILHALAASDIATIDTIFVLTGPEGGFTADEIAALESTNSCAVYLGNNILRSETASLTMAGIAKLWTHTANEQ